MLTCHLSKRLYKKEVLRILDTIKGYPYSNNYLRKRNYLIFLILIYTGIRKSELINLKVFNFDTEKKQLLIEQGKGSKDRVIPLHPTILRELNMYMEIRKKIKTNSPDMFLNTRTKKYLTKDGLKNLVQRIREASGVHFNLHILRHTFASVMIESGCDIYNLSQMLGHSDIKTTTIYLASNKAYMRGQIMKFNL